MTPLRLLADGGAPSIVADAVDMLCATGVEFHSEAALGLLGDHGARIDLSRRRAYFTPPLVERALDRAPDTVRLYDVHGGHTHTVGGSHVSFVPGSSALQMLDAPSGEVRGPLTLDYVRYVKVTDQLTHLAAQSTAFVPGDVDARISDSYRLFLSLLHGRKPVVTGAFSPSGLDVMLDLQLAVRGTAGRLAEKPLTVFSCCPTSPLKWSDQGCRTILRCGAAGVPLEIVPMPLAGFTAPVTLIDVLAQHAAEALSGIVLQQIASPGAPVLYGGASAIFDVRYETTPMGAVETMMLACGCAEVGRHLGLPTQAYIAVSDAKHLDAQAGAETGMGAVLAALSGINSISGPGMLDFLNAFSIEKLLLDHEICRIALRLREGVRRADDGSILPIMQELVDDGHLLIADHTRRHAAREIPAPPCLIDRASRPRWIEEGRPTLVQRAAAEAAALERSYEPVCHPAEVARGLVERMDRAARHAGMERLPDPACAV